MVFLLCVGDMQYGLEQVDVRWQCEFEVCHLSLCNMQGYMSQFIGKCENGLRVSYPSLVALLHHRLQVFEPEGVGGLCQQ